MSRTHNAGIVTAYGAAVRGGYTGTYEQFCAQQAQYAENARQMEQAVNDVRQIKTSVESAVSEAEGYANNANQSATNASNSATQASESASNANQSAESASQFANNASNSANSASQSATSAQTSANNASASEQSARQSVETAQDILDSVQAEGNTQIGRVQAKGNEILNSLPSDFTQVQNDIAALNGSLVDVKADLGDLTDLETSDKSNLVAAINEVAQTGGADAVSLLKEQIYNSYPNVEAETGSIVSISDGADGIPVKSLVVEIEPAQAGSGDPSPTNVRPISGWTGVNVTRCRKNLLPPHSKAVITSQGVTFTNDNGKYIINGTSVERAVCDIVVHLPPGEYTFAGFNQLGAPMSVYIMANSTVLHNISLNTDNTVNTFTLTQSADMVRFTVAKNITIENGTANLEIVKGAIAPTEWEPYSVNIYSIIFPSEAGTVYGGTLNVTTGVLTVDMAIVDMGTLNWIYYSAQQRLAAQVNSGKPAWNNAGLDGACSAYKVVNTPYRLAPDKSVVIGNNFISNSVAAMVVHDEDYTDAETFKTAVSGQMLVFPIKTPVTYQLTPTEVTTLLGTNNVWADTGDSTVEYRADTKLYIDGVYVDYRTMLAPVESTYTATRNYTTGQLLIVGNTLYKVTANIANGGTITAGTNIVATTLSEVIASLS